jgi:hypothetical protein
MNVIKEPVAATRNEDILRTLQEMAIVSVAAHLEEFLKCVVGLASVHREREFREFLAAHGNDQERAASQTCNWGELMRFARRRVTFKEKGKKLERICRLLLEAAPWSDEDSRRYVCDLVRVRNIVVHHGGWPEEEHAKDVETQGVVVRTNNFFWKLELQDFLGPALSAAAFVGITLTNAAERHPKFRL